MITYNNLGANGRLGNQLWQVASTMGIALQKTGSHLNARFPTWSYREFFSIPEVFFDRAPTNSEDLGLDYLQRFEYIEPILPEIKEYFQPSPLVDLDKSYPWFADLEHTTAVHVRRGDSIGKEQWHPLVPPDYYRKAMRNVLARNPATTFLIFSDDNDWCRQAESVFCHATKYVSPPTENITHEANRPNPGDHEELMLMARCNEHITANSTYSYWGALLSDNPSPINPRTWYGPLLAGWHQRAFIPQGWITL